MINYEKHLNDEQLQVVMEEGGPILVIAGAGSGKTRALTYRVARLIETGVPPERILLATFTNKAAKAMLARVKTLVTEDVSRLCGGTFHHNAHLILRHNAHLLGYQNNFSIMDGDDAKQLMASSLAEIRGKVEGDKFPKGNILADIISLSHNRTVDIAAVLQDRYPFFYRYLEDIAAVAARYEFRKKTLNFMDFDDLLLNLRKLLRDFPEVKRHYAERFSHVLVDEYQDTNLLQAEIVDLLASHHRNLMVVGDDSQSIYSFRGANFANIIEFPERYPDCRIFKLETNYRSTPEILHLANLSITNNERQFQKTLKPVRECGIKPILIPARNVFQQAVFVAQRIRELDRDGLPLNEIAVLYRAHYHSMELQMELTRWGIPFEIRSGIRFFEQAHIKDVVCYLRILANPYDELAWKRLLGLYSKIGKATAGKVWQFISRQQEALAVVAGEDFIKCAGKGAVPGLTQCRETLRKLLAADGSQGDIPALIQVVLDSGYLEYMQGKFTDTAQREDDLTQLAGYAEKFFSLENFLSELALMTNADEEEDKIETENSGRIVLSSIHQAKGLEWSVVFMLWCAEGMMPLARALSEPEGEEEERRLFYVAVTRAKDELYLCYPLVDYGRGMGNLTISPSRFIRELAPAEMRHRDRPYEQWVVDEE
ncbi:MAG: ATP-dependent helicase [Deltaproteobacteria bacterium]|nr:ATP-dependent helicase [Deltaproteobacteria bacterium]